MEHNNTKSYCYSWKKMSNWGCSPTRKNLILWNRPLLTIPRKAQRAFLKWSTPENASLEDLRYPPKGHADAEWNPPKYGLPLCQKPPIGKGWPLAQSSGLNPPKWLQSGALPRWTTSPSLKTAQSVNALLLHECNHRSSCKVLMEIPHPSKHLKSPRAECGISERRHPMY